MRKLERNSRISTETATEILMTLQNPNYVSLSMAINSKYKIFVERKENGKMEQLRKDWDQ